MNLTEVIRFRVSPELKQKFKDAAKARDMNLSKWFMRLGEKELERD